MTVTWPGYHHSWVHTTLPGGNASEVLGRHLHFHFAATDEWDIVTTSDRSGTGVGVWLCEYWNLRSLTDSVLESFSNYSPESLCQHHHPNPKLTCAGWPVHRPRRYTIGFRRDRVHLPESMLLFLILTSLMFDSFVDWVAAVAFCGWPVGQYTKC